MDLHQMINQHSRPWSAVEICFFFAIFCALASILTARRLHGKMHWQQVIACCLIFIYYFVILESTVFGRADQGKVLYELELFWSWRAVFAWHSRAILEENLLNLVMLLPIGVLLPLAIGKKARWWMGLIIGAMASLAIELLQLFLRRGLFEFDDIVHNAIGAMVGCLIGSLILRLEQAEDSCEDNARVKR